MSILQELIKNHPNNWDLISRNPNITIEDIYNNPDIPWNWAWVTSNPIITMEIIKENSWMPWHRYRIAMKLVGEEIKRIST